MDANYETFIKKLDEKLALYFNAQKKDICCKRGCSECCEKGDYPLTEIELLYLMQGHMKLAPETKKQVQENIKNMEKGGACPYLINKECSIYQYRPIICRVHGLAYKHLHEKIKVPHCVKNGKNFSKIYENGEIYIAPINENLDTMNILEGVVCGEMRNLYDWITHNKS
ncbi:MAG: YkgJ family cysteine cluster protein [bacterium]|nr:YkgJ family cysteine cluster protein [bacterium]